MRPLRGVLRLTRKRSVVMIPSWCQLENRFGSEPSTVRQFVDDVFDAIGEDVPHAVDPRYFRSRFAAVTYAFKFNFPILRRNQEITLDDFRGIGRHQDCYRSEAASDARLAQRARLDLTLITGVVV